MNGITLLTPRWPAPRNVRAAVSTRVGGTSAAPWNSLNLGAHVGDRPEDVAENRRRFATTAGLPAEPLWLDQVHGTCIADAGELAASANLAQADGSVAREPGLACAVLTADCLPILLCDTGGTRVAAVHAGWRGLANGVIEAALEALALPPAQLLVWLGPAIGPAAFEVGDEVRERFADCDAGAAAAFEPAGDRWRADIYALARRRLLARGVSRLFGGGHCTVTDASRYFSYRRDGQTGRMASVVWLEHSAP